MSIAGADYAEARLKDFGISVQRGPEARLEASGVVEGAAEESRASMRVAARARRRWLSVGACGCCEWFEGDEGARCLRASEAGFVCRES